MARPSALAPLGAVFRSIGSTLEGIGSGIADTTSREKRLIPSSLRACLLIFGGLRGGGIGIGRSVSLQEPARASTPRAFGGIGRLR